MPPKKKPIPKALKIAVWDKYIGEIVGKTKCLCCKITDITQLKFHCGHIIAEANGGTLDIDNLMPICESCNKSMRTNNMNDFKKILIPKEKTELKNSKEYNFLQKKEKRQEKDKEEQEKILNNIFEFTDNKNDILTNKEIQKVFQSRKINIKKKTLKKFLQDNKAIKYKNNSIYGIRYLKLKVL
jgi:hypothetical protein